VTLAPPRPILRPPQRKQRLHQCLLQGRLLMMPTGRIGRLLTENGFIPTRQADLKQAILLIIKNIFLALFATKHPGPLH
jgi:hypothetical protein